MGRRPNGRAVKKHRSYTVDEAARTLHVSKGTVRRWLKVGLPALADRRPTLILGYELIAFLEGRKGKRQVCELHQGFCFSCRAPRDPAFGEVEISPKTASTVTMQALCHQCATVMHKPVSLARLPELRAKVAVSNRQEPERLDDGSSACPNDHFPTRS